MPQSKIYKDMLLAELALEIKNSSLALSLFTRLSEDIAIQKNLYLYSRILFNLGICHVIFERYDLAYVQFMKANTVWPNAPWVSFAIENSLFCIQELGGEALAFEEFRKKTLASRNIDTCLSMAYHAYHLNTVYEKALDKELKQIEGVIKILPSREVELTEAAHKKAIAIAFKTCLFYLNRAFKINPNDTIVLKLIVSLNQEMNERNITEWSQNEEAMYKLTSYFRKENQSHKAWKIYHDWFESIEKKRLGTAKPVSMLGLLDLEAECYEEMGKTQLAVETLRRQAGLFGTQHSSLFERIQNKQKKLNDAVIEEKHTALDSLDTKKRFVSPEVSISIQSSLIQWKSHTNVRPGIGYLRFFTSEESTTEDSIMERHPLRPNL